MVDDSDWRLQGQEKYLKGVSLVRRTYRGHANNPSWDHDHCEFCWSKFMVEDLPEVLHEGYATLDEYRWICEACFQDFRGRFAWILVDSGDNGDAQQAAPADERCSR